MNRIVNKQTFRCSHCGKDYEENILHSADKHFCSISCKEIYETRISRNPDIENNAVSDLDYLDDPLYSTLLKRSNLHTGKSRLVFNTKVNSIKSLCNKARGHCHDT